jgi:hypothetical protein
MVVKSGPESAEVKSTSRRWCKSQENHV